MRDRIIEGREHFGSRSPETGIARHDDVAPAGQRAFGQRLESLSPHDDGVSHGEFFEAAQIGADMEKQIARPADGEVGSDGDDYVD